MKYFCIVLLLFSFQASKAQIINEKEVDDKLEISKKEFFKLNFFKSILHAKEAYEMSRKNKYSKGKAISSIYIAKALVELGDYKNSLKYVLLSEKEPFFNEYVNLQVESYRIKGRIYGYLNMNVLAEREFKKQLINSEKIENKEQRSMSVFWSYQNLSHIYTKTNNIDSLNKYLQLQEKKIKDLDIKANFYSISATYCQLAENLIRQTKYQEAKKYLNKAMKVSKEFKSKYLFSIYESFGNLEKAKGNIKEAELNFNLALKNAIKLKDEDAIAYYYKVLSDFFALYDDKLEMSKFYFLKHKKLEDSINDVNSYVLDEVYTQVIKEQKKIRNKQINKYWYIIIGMLSFTSLFLIYSDRKKSKLLKLNLKKKSKILKQSLLINKLKNKVNSTKYKDLVQLAKSNDPNFILLFEEIYPDLIAKIKKINPKISNSEISFLALAHLNFSTKQISQILNVTVRAVQIRKNRYRKKYGIPSEIDFNLWYHSLKRK